MRSKFGSSTARRERPINFRQRLVLRFPRELAASRVPHLGHHRGERERLREENTSGPRGATEYFEFSSGMAEGASGGGGAGVAKRDEFVHFRAIGSPYDSQNEFHVFRWSSERSPRQVRESGLTFRGFERGRASRPTEDRITVHILSRSILLPESYFFFFVTQTISLHFTIRTGLCRLSQKINEKL